MCDLFLATFDVMTQDRLGECARLFGSGVEGVQNRRRGELFAAV